MTLAESTKKATPIIFGRKRGRVVILLCVMYFIAYFDRNNIATAGPDIIKEFGLTNAEFGLAAAVFSLFYAFLQVAGGFVGEKLGPRLGLLILGLGWGFATMLTGFANGLIMLLIARALLGLTESATFPTATQAMSRWVPPDRNGFVQGIVHSASRLGNAAAPIIVGLLISLVDWRFSFIAVGVVSAGWALVWYLMFRDRPSEMKGITQKELSEVVAIPKAADRPPVPWRRLALTILPVTLVDFGYGWVAWVFFTWIPQLLSTTYDLDVAKFAPLTSLILVGGVVGDFLGGVLSDRQLLRTGDALRSRKTWLVAGFVGSAICLVPLVFAPPLWVAVAALGLSFFFLELCNAQVWSIPMDVAPTWSGTASGMMNTGFAVAGILSPIVVGALADATGGFATPFGLSIGILAAATLLTIFMRPKRIDPVAPPSERIGLEGGA